MSIADIIAALYTDVLHIADPADPERDRLVLSKGHAALALYAALYLKGWLSEEALNTFCADGTLLGVHPEHALRGVDFSTGSLGQGLSMGAGAALAARLQKSPRRAFVVVSDAECNEGSLWEAVMYAAHNQLANLIAIVDLNGQQALGYTEQVMNLSPLAARWRAFGWNVKEVDGHNTQQIAETINALDTQPPGQPTVLLAKTQFGHGVSFMRGIQWHYLPMNDLQFEQALREVEAEVG